MEVLPLPSTLYPSAVLVPQILVKRLSPGADSTVHSQRERKRQARMSSAHVAVPSPPQNHPKAQKAVYLFYGNTRGLGTKSKGPGQCCMYG